MANYLAKQCNFHDQIKTAMPGSKLWAALCTPDTSGSTPAAPQPPANQIVASGWGDGTSRRGVWDSYINTSYALLQINGFINPNQFVEDSYPTQTSKWIYDSGLNLNPTNDWTHPHSYGASLMAPSITAGMFS